MQKVSSLIVLCLIAGAAAAALVIYNIPSRSNAAAGDEVASHFDDSVAIEERVAALENAVSEERRARQLLEEEVLVVYAEIERLESERNRDSDGDERSITRQAPASTQAVNLAQLGEGGRVNDPQDRRNSMIAAGLSPERADHILRRESEMRFEMMQAYYQARNSGESFDRFSMSPDAMLRADIGDADYEKYLQANGRSTTVGVAGVMAASPAERAGLQPGDEIVGYDGERVFSTSDLMQRTMEPGDGNVVVDVVRDGSPMQVVLPRGPIGVETGRFRSR